MLSSLRSTTDVQFRPSQALSATDLGLGFLLFLGASLLVLRNVDVVSPIMGHDEYAYFSQAREFPDLANLQSYDPTGMRSNNLVYFWLGHIFWRTVDPAASMRAFQSILYVGILPIFYLTCRHFLPRPTSAFVAVVGLLTARSTYSTYFMPDTIYTFLFALLFLGLVRFANQPVMIALVSGALAATLTLTKPHGIAVAMAVALTFGICILLPQLANWVRTQAAIALGVFVVTFYVSLITLNATLTGHLRLHPLLFVGDGYMAFFSAKQPIGAIRDLLIASAGNGIALAVLVGFPIIYIAVQLFTHRGYPAGWKSPVASKTGLSLAFLICATITTVGMTVNFTAQYGGPEIWRVHGRLYSFVIPMYLMLMFAVNEQCHSHAVGSKLFLRVPAILGLAIVVIAQLFLRVTFTVNPFDFPELFVFTSWPWWPTIWLLGTVAGVVGVIVFAAIIAWPGFGPALFACYFVFLNVLSLHQTIIWQFAHMHGIRPLTEAGSVLRMLLPPDALDRGMIIAPDREKIPYFLFALRSRSQVALLAPNSIVNEDTIGSAEWVVLEGRYDVHLEGARVLFRRDPLTVLVRQSTPLL